MMIAALTAFACAPSVKRDLSQTPAGQVGFDDLCGLQVYFDKLATKEGTPPTVVLSAEVERQRPGMPRSGRTRFAFETELQLQTVRRVLDENWQRLPEETAKASRIELQVRWSEKAGVRRVVTNESAELTVGTARTSLPYHPCLSELLFGEPLYKRRRSVLQLAPLPTTAPWLSGQRSDGGSDLGNRDAGASDRTTDGG